MIKRTICLSLTLLLLLLSACKANTPTDNVSSSQSGTVDTALSSISLLYSMSDSINPYKAETQANRRLSTLLYDSLVQLDTAFQPHFSLAESIELNGTECTVTLRSARFSDGTSVTADDVVFSLKRALESELTAYSRSLATVKSCKAEGQNRIVITLSKADPYFANLLTFPVIKSGTDERKDENNISLPPIGSGRYIYDTASRSLKSNPDHIDGQPTVAEIKLINAPDETVVKYNLEAGNVSIYYTDLSDGVIPPMSGSSSSVRLTDLVYLGINLSNKHLKNAELRYALASAVDRTAVCDSAYYSYATPATGLFNEAWEDAKGLQNLSYTADSENVVANLSKIGYNKKDEEGFFLDSDGKTFKLRLLAYNGNERRLNAAKLLCEQLESSGFRAELVSVDWDGYISALESGSFELYIAEVSLLPNMDVTELVTSDGTLAYGIPDTSTSQKPTDGKESDNSAKTTPDGDFDTADIPLDGSDTVTVSAYSLDSTVAGFYKGELSIVDIINAFNAEMPIIPICHRCGLTVCSSSVGVTEMSSVSDVFFGITNINKTK